MMRSMEEEPIVRGRKIRSIIPRLNDGLIWLTREFNESFLWAI